MIKIRFSKMRIGGRKNSGCWLIRSIIMFKVFYWFSGSVDVFNNLVFSIIIVQIVSRGMMLMSRVIV